MSVGPFPTDLVVQRLKTNATSLKSVGVAADLAAAMRQPPARIPAAFVIVQEQAQPRGSATGIFFQQVQATVTVVLYLRNYSGADLGGPAAAEMDSLVTDVRNALLGFAPNPQCIPLTLQAGRAEAYVGGGFWWQDIYRSNYRIEVRP